MTKEELRVYRTEWMRRYRGTAKGREASRAAAKRYNDAHKGRSTEAVRKHRERNPDASKKSYEKLKTRSPECLLLWGAKARAKRNDTPFDLNIEDINIPDVCPLLGVPLIYGHVDNAPSLDRLRPEFGYVKGNVLVVSRRANRIKNDASLAELTRITTALKDIIDV